MRTLFLIVIFLHGLLHLLGFVKGFGLGEVKELTLPISKTLGGVWLLASLLLGGYGVAYMVQAKHAWLLGLIALGISQLLIILFWQDAKFGTIPNMLILLLCVSALAYNNFQQMVERETARLIPENPPAQAKIVHENDLKQLPLAVQKWLKDAAIIGQPMIHSAKISQRAEMQMSAGQSKWMSATAIQFTNLEEPSFIWKVDAKMNAFLHFQGRDKFENGKGEMLIKLNTLIKVVDERGEKIDEGSLQRYLGEMLWFPSLALSPYIRWEAIDENSAKATMHYKGTTGSGVFHFNDAGEPLLFSALRYMGNEADAKRHKWTMHILDYKTFEGIKVPAKMTATWALDEGEWTWLKLEVTDIQYK